ncbi:MAG: hypothetical protein JKY66_06235 [Spongiibacteraceae bacterium]|nr:hypothetical protein [Spongiibacteraceae bacterium]
MLPTVKVKPFILLAIVLILAGCSSQKSQWKAQIGQKLVQAQSAIDNLESSLSRGTIRNALLLTSYGDALKRQNPDMASVVNVLVQDAKWDGPMAKNLKDRLERAKGDAPDVLNRGEKDVTRFIRELDAITDGSSPVLYGLMLSDPINVIADMSNGTLGRVESMSKNASASANNEADYGKGSQLIGNPHYGGWQSGIGGQSIWAWYGMYSLFSNFSRGPVYYGSWASQRPYSYYSDYGRNYYTSPSQRSSQNDTRARTEKKFKQQGKSFNSPYAKKRTGGAATASVTQRAARSSRKSSSFKSSYSSSQRSSSYKTSRSFGGGK